MLSMCHFLFILSVSRSQRTYFCCCLTFVSVTFFVLFPVCRRKSIGIRRARASNFFLLLCGNNTIECLPEYNCNMCSIIYTFTWFCPSIWTCNLRIFPAFFACCCSYYLYCLSSACASVSLRLRSSSQTFRNMEFIWLVIYKLNIVWNHTLLTRVLRLDSLRLSATHVHCAHCEYLSNVLNPSNNCEYIKNKFLHSLIHLTIWPQYVPYNVQSLFDCWFINFGFFS